MPRPIHGSRSIYGAVPHSPQTTILVNVDGRRLLQIWIPAGWISHKDEVGRPRGRWLRSQHAYAVSGMPGYFLKFEEALEFFTSLSDHVPDSYQDHPTLEEGHSDVQMLYRLKITKRNSAKAGSEHVTYGQASSLAEAEAKAALLQKDPSITVAITPDVFGYLRLAHPHLKRATKHESTYEELDFDL